MKTSRDELLLIAFRLFLTKGYEGTTMTDLASASGLSKGAFHHHFSRKPDLFEACVDHFFTGVLPAEEPTEAPDSTALVRTLAAGYGEHLAGLLDQQIDLASYFRFLLSLLPDRADLVRGRQQAVEAEIARLYRRDVAEGRVLRPQPPEAFARQVTATLEGQGLLWAWAADPTADEIRNSFTRCAEGLLAGIAPAAERAVDVKPRASRRLIKTARVK